MDNLKDEFPVVSIDESFFFYDSLVRKVWIGKDERPLPEGNTQKIFQMPSIS
jgi:hypothetical protein